MGRKHGRLKNIKSRQGRDKAWHFPNAHITSLTGLLLQIARYNSTHILYLKAQFSMEDNELGFTTNLSSALATAEVVQAIPAVGFTCGYSNLTAPRYFMNLP